MPNHFTELQPYQDVDYAWRDVMISLLDRVEDHSELTGGTRTQESRDGDVVAETHGLQFCLDASLGRTLLRCPTRGVDPAYCAAEVLWCVSGTDKIEPLLPYAPMYQEKYGEPDRTAWGAYGARLERQWASAIEVLRRHPEGRQCVMKVWHEADLEMAKLVPPGKRDIPCLTEIMFLKRKKKLHMSAVMRSQDAWLGLPCDVFAFTCLQRLVAAEVDCEVGGYCHCVPGSTHLYARYLERTKEAVRWSPPVSPTEPHEWRLDDTFDSIRVAIDLERQLSHGLLLELERFNVMGDMAKALLCACAQKSKRCDHGLGRPRWTRLQKEYPR